MKFIGTALLFTVIASVGFAGTIDDITEVNCSNGTGSYFKLNTSAKLVEASFVGSYENLSNRDAGPYAFIDVLPNFPKRGLTSIGTLVPAEGGNYGNVSVAFDNERLENLNVSETAMVYFINPLGQGTQEMMDCQLTF